MTAMSRYFPLVIIPILILASCGNRTASKPGDDSINSQSPALQNPPEVQAGSQMEAEQEPLLPMSTAMPTGSDEAAPVAMKTPETTIKAAETASKPPPVASKPLPAGTASPASRAVVVQPARTLAGHDRFLVSRPVSSIRPADFILSLLLDRTTDPTLLPLLDGLAEAMKDKKLETAGFSNNGLMLAKLLYETDLASAPAITKVRYSEPRRIPGASYAVAFRLFSESGSADGLVLFGSDDDGKWMIEQLDLELDGLDTPRERTGLWDPYGYSRNSLD
jgi:hypothetical protein